MYYTQYGSRVEILGDYEPFICNGKETERVRAVVYSREIIQEQILNKNTLVWRKK